jgi:hypothetical protein
MEFLHASVALLASMVLVLAGMVGWVYWQQTRLFQNMNSIIMVISDLARPAPAPEPEEEQKVAVPTVPDEDDDRLSVEKTPEVVEGPPEPFDTDGLEQKTKKELQEILTKRGIPYSRSDGKTALLSLIKATA